MAEKIQGRPWQPHEDALLLSAIHSTQGDIDWKIIAKSVPNRTNKACRKRWLHSLCPTVKKTGWTQDEDDTLLRLYETHGPKWALIARAIPGRTDDACSKRYREALDPSLRRDEWTADEDARLIELQVSMHGKWGQIGPAMGRSGLGCRNRWRLLERKKAAGHRTNGTTAKFSGAADSMIEPQAGPSTLPTLQPQDEQQMPHWGEDLLAWDTQYQPPPTPAYSYEQTHLGSLSFYAAESDPHMQTSHGSTRDYDMYSSTGSFPPGNFLGRMDFAQNRHIGRQPARSDVDMSDYGAITHPEYSLVPDFHSTDQTYLVAHDHEPQAPITTTFTTRILDSQIDPALTNMDLDGLIQPRPLPQYPPRVVSAAQRIQSIQQPAGHPASSVSFSLHHSPLSPAAPTDSMPPSPVHDHSPSPSSQLQIHVPSSNPRHELPPDPATVPSSQSAPSPGHIISNLSRQPSPVVQPSSPPPDIPSRHRSQSLNEEPFDGQSLPPAPSYSNSAQPLPPSIQPNARPSSPPLPATHASPPSPAPSSPADEPTASQSASNGRTRKKPFLSAFLPASSNPAILAYACGMSECWPTINYATSSELAEHMRTVHPDFLEDPLDPEFKAYRCALTGCEKRWKNLNGLQYHLQVSKDHFRDALGSIPSAPPPTQGQKKGRKTHPCTVPGCTNVYKQLAGLRYHLKHGHPTDTPTQLDAVPPTLAKKVSERQARKGGLKPSMESSPGDLMASA